MKDLYGKKEKHDHKFSNLLKGCILAIVMLAPFIAILSKIVYVSANKNAKDSYYGETINEEIINKVNSINDLVKNEKYTFRNNEYLLYDQNITLRTSVKNLKYNNQEWENANLNFITSQQVYYAEIYSNSLYQTGITLTNTLATIEFEYIQVNAYSGDIQRILNYITYKTYNKYSYLDNVFYYALDQSKESELLKWTKETPIYNVISTMNTGLGLSNNHILTYLLTYWSIILAIYIVFDIIIFIFTKITHYLQ